jgi:hypothetical protein
MSNINSTGTVTTANGIKVLNNVANVDPRKATIFTSRQDALDSIDASTLFQRVNGLSLLVEEGDGIVEYIFDGGILDENFKQFSVTQTSELLNNGADGLNPFIDEVEQEVIIGGVYDNFQVEGNIIVATNTDGKAVFTGFNISEDYKIIYLINNSNFEIQIDNENSSSLEENQISLPNNTASVGLQGTTKFAYITKGGLNKWQIIDVFGSRYMPEHQGLDQDAAVVVGEGSVSRAKQIVNLHDTNEAITSDTLTDAELNALYRDYTVGFEVFCENAGDNGIIYKNINNTTKTWRKIVLT